MQSASNAPTGPTTVATRAELPIDQSVESVLQANWPMPIWLTIVLAAIAFAFVLALYWSERGKAASWMRGLLATIRFTLLALVVWMLAGWSWLQFRSDKPELIFMLDRSASMDTQDGTTNASESAARTRFADAIEWLSSMRTRDRERLERNYAVRWLMVDDGVEPVNIALDSIGRDLGNQSASGSESRLGDAIANVIGTQAGRGTAAIVFVSDGINTSGAPLSSAAAQARSAGIPVYVVATGKELALPDARLIDLLADEVVFLGDQVTLLVNVSISDLAEANLTLRLKDQSSGEVLAQEPVKLDKDRSQQQVSLAFIPKQAGELNLQLELSEAPGETNRENNVLQRTLQVQDKTLRVLLVQRQPSFEFRFLKNLLQRSQATDARSASFELNSVLQEADSEYVEQDSAAIRLVPSDPETLASFDVFIFGDLNPELISRSAQQAIFEQVTASGAGCMFIAGRDTPLTSLAGWPIGDLLPVQLDNSTASLQSIKASNPTSTTNASDVQMIWSPTSLGSSALPLQLGDSAQASARIWSSLPPSVSVYRALTPKVGSQVLAVGAASEAASTAGIGNSQREGAMQPPILISQFAGAGRVALQATDETYRWSSYGGSDRYHQRYWEQMLRWLSRGRLSGDAQQTRLAIEPRRARLSEPIRFELSLGSDVEMQSNAGRVELTLETSSGQKSTLALARDVGSNRIYSATKSDLAPGSYRAIVFQPTLQSPPSENFSVVAPPGELANLRADWGSLRQLAEQSRGRFYLSNQAQKLFEELPLGKPARLGTLPPLPLWNSPWVAAAFVLLITSEWLLRRRARML